MQTMLKGSGFTAVAWEDRPWPALLGAVTHMQASDVATGDRTGECQV